MNLIKNKHDTPCSVDGCTSIYIYRKKDWLCQYHLNMEYFKKSNIQVKTWKTSSRKPIRKRSLKLQFKDRIYSRTRLEFLSLPENKICFIDGCGSLATTVEHTAGRIGEKYLDQKFWKPCCLEHNQELENNPEMSKKYQLSKIHGGKKI